MVRDLVVSAGYAVMGRWRERYDDMDTERAIEMLESLGAEHLAARSEQKRPKQPAAAKADLSLADVQAQFDKLQLEADQSFTALSTIYARGGEKVTIAMLTELQKLPVQVQTELANAGQPAFDKFVDDEFASLRATMVKAGIYLVAGKPEELVPYYNKVLEVYRALGSREGEAAILATLGPLYAEMDQPEKARESLERALSIFRAAGVRHLADGYSVSLEQVTEKIRYDLFYVKQMSLWLDLRILARTALVVMRRQGVA